MKKLIFLLLFCISVANVSSQTSKNNVTDSLSQEIFWKNLTNSQSTEKFYKAESDSMKQEIYWKAVRLYNEESYGKAILYFRHLNESDPDNYEYSFYIGMCFHNLSKPKLARYYFTKVIDDNTYKFKIMLLTYNSLEEMPSLY